jgi:hypothetical protein
LAGPGQRFGQLLAGRVHIAQNFVALSYIAFAGYYQLLRSFLLLSPFSPDSSHGLRFRI